MSPRYVQVAVPVPLPGLFTYRVDGDAEVGPGHRVRVPFGRRHLAGLVVSGPDDALPDGLARERVKAVDEVLDTTPLVGPTLMRLARWLADYYQTPPGEAYSLLVPPRMGGGRSGRVQAHTFKTRHVATLVESAAAHADRRLGARMRAAVELLSKRGPTDLDVLRTEVGANREVLRRLEARGLVTLTAERVYRDPFQDTVEASAAPPLTAPQAAAVGAVSETLDGYHGVLLHGVTGSGKTEVYLALIAEVLTRGRGALVLVPEIALTPQLVQRFRARLGDRVAVQHSGLDPQARQEQWLRIDAGELSVVIGARSALFAPVRDLGIIIVDEEHEPSFKQDSAPRYHARDLALVRGQLEGVPVVLGSATPSTESWANVVRGKLTRLALQERVMDRPMPTVQLVDLKNATFADSDRLFSDTLLSALTGTVGQGEQAILFLNRRGFSSFVLCRACGESIDCESCSVTYTWHRRRARLVCHYCDRSRVRPALCQACGSDALAEMGFGTEQVELRLAELMPEARIARMDRDTTRGSRLPKLLNRFRRGEIDILIGTQMVAKGHDFPNVTLVGVLLAELGLAFPDFRAAERTFQLMTQIAGRAGRAHKAGRVLIQTYVPQHYALKFAVDHDSRAFLEHELELRAARGFPPSSHLALFRVTGVDRSRTERAVMGLGALLREVAGSVRGVSIHPPQPAPIERIKDRWRYQVLVNGATRSAVHHVTRAAGLYIAAGNLGAGVHAVLDVDPIAFL